MFNNNQIHFINLTELKERGWKNAAIKKFLGEPDKTKPNPKSQKAAPTKLYNFKRVKQAESSEAFINWRIKSGIKRLKRKIQTLEPPEVERRKLLDWVVSLPINIISTYEYPQLVKIACNHYNGRKQELVLVGLKEDLTPDELASPESKPNFLYRIICNYLSHEKTSYEYEFTKIFRRIEKYQGYEILHARFCWEIEKAYPDLEGFLYSEYEKQQENRRARVSR